jgi:2'-5' RNA ligase
LWLEPVDPAPLQAWIAGAAERCGVPVLPDHLPPHVTLGSCTDLAEAEVVAGAERIAARLATVQFERAGFASFSGTRHRVLVVLARAEALAPAFDLLRGELAQAEPSRPPHLSLAYGDPAPGPCLAMLGEVYGPSDPMPDRFELRRLTVRDTTGSDETAWRRLLGGWELGA